MLINFYDVPVRYFCCDDWARVRGEIRFVDQVIDVTGDARYQMATRASRPTKLKILEGMCIP
ncbi:hypothetical protein [Actinomadura macra]|uniref:hypothetical protein n=1 Tax=Actinomadura macra TaxID=46164 RepID=UPI0012F74D17|nr:hypothetical protein [Actinomadura macra]